jgi:hypothetical protein
LPFGSLDLGEQMGIPHNHTMNAVELEERLWAARVRTDSYALDGEPKNEALILEPSLGNGWRIYYCERGVRTGEKAFAIEAEACDYFLERMLRDPLVREY